MNLIFFDNFKRLHYIEFLSYRQFLKFHKLTHFWSYSHYAIDLSDHWFWLIHSKMFCFEASTWFNWVIRINFPIASSRIKLKWHHGTFAFQRISWQQQPKIHCRLWKNQLEVNWDFGSRYVLDRTGYFMWIYAIYRLSKWFLMLWHAIWSVCCLPFKALHRHLNDDKSKNNRNAKTASIHTAHTNNSPSVCTPAKSIYIPCDSSSLNPLNVFN